MTLVAILLATQSSTPRPVGGKVVLPTALPSAVQPPCGSQTRLLRSAHSLLDGNTLRSGSTPTLARTLVMLISGMATWLV
ncbi:hypothetical protein PAXRUDRAFT_827430 [Paxillus rubicundulus Ve08.2h10]|uniref:Unplaced genomic scaffold scaffold_249, whole genome shotgun sequence n=1 Tax=Paxillus rubicundulus Ve08.2h10 TaxID=930991 RepID=A0A0D0DXX8_9AGAM|nr:hypothetical protein PAXRUDRAFT_827430 [Paxillus rubicundulus Ve08.2h10]